ncbi:MAG TPA: c-type cytochrome [Methylosinus sp.]|jgi:mono/diheme cytochrome c family protein
MRLPRLVFAASLTIAASMIFAAPPSRAADRLVAKGAAIAAKYCGGCHAIGPGASPHADAPPFHEIAGRLSLDNLEDMFADAIASHAQMARVSLSHGQLQALAGYMAAMR